MEKGELNSMWMLQKYSKEQEQVMPWSLINQTPEATDKPQTPFKSFRLESFTNVVYHLICSVTQWHTLKRYKTYAIAIECPATWWAYRLVCWPHISLFHRAGVIVANESAPDHRSLMGVANAVKPQSKKARRFYNIYELLRNGMFVRWMLLPFVA